MYRFQTALKDYFDTKQLKNPRYSLRRMAQTFKMSPAFLSRLLAGNRIPSFKMAKKLCVLMKLNESHTTEFIESVNQAFLERDSKKRE